MGNLIDVKHFVPVANYLDLSASATNPCDSINMENFHDVIFYCQIAAIGGAAMYVAPFSGATDAALTSAVPFFYALGGAAAGSANCDVLTATTQTDTAISLAHATYDNYMLIIHVEASAMDIANGENWLTLSFPDTAGGLTGNVTVGAILTPRYAGESTPTALT